ncbi:MAG: cation:proton antiporter subunit C [Synergistaceae bacterium]|nr:cation:proton antiporter subunit C [Synergistaceae bacterium]MBR0152020.1 cation:proton antiporter subunit C [Synergistaceae bacterium]MBR0256686.1 cation:proton antiporter subunit C [Synergistaceae bacterium]
MLEKLLLNHYEAAAVILSGIGLTNLLLQRNLIKKIIGLNIMDTAVYLFLAAKGYVAGRAAPILIPDGAGGWITSSSVYVNPIPAGLVLTGIVVSVSVTAFALALTLKLYESYGTLNIDEALMKMTQEQEQLEARIDEAQEEAL